MHFKIITLTSAVILISGIVGLLLGDWLYSPVICFFSFNTFLFSAINSQVKRTNSARQLGWYTLGITILYIMIDFDHHWGVRSIFYINPDHLSFTIHSILTASLLVYGVSRIIVGGQYNVLKTKTHFRFFIIALIAYVLYAVPLFDIHGDISGNQHAHNYLHGLHFH